MSNKTFSGASMLLSLSLGVFLVLFGAQGIMESNGFEKSMQTMTTLFGASQEPEFLSLTFSILEVLGGALLFLLPFGILQPNVAGAGVTVVVLVWLAKTVLEFFVYGKPFQPSGLVWWRSLALNVVILASIWRLRPRRER